MAFDDFSDEETVGVSCVKCGDTPCRWVLHRSEVVRRVEAVYGDHLRTLVAGEVEYRKKLLSACRRYAFQVMCFLVHGSLGRGIRIKHADCVEDGVRDVWQLLPGQRPAGFMES